MRFVSRMAAAQLGLAMAALAVMGSVTVADVALKYLLGRPIVGAYDLVEGLLPVVIFHGMPATLLRRQNIVIDLVDHVVGPKSTRVLSWIADATTLVLLSLLGSAMLAPALQAFEYGDRKIELGLPLAAVWAAAILGMVGSIAVAVTLVFTVPGRPADDAAACVASGDA